MTEPVEAPIIEFGRATQYSSKLGWEPETAVYGLLMADIKKHEELLDHLKVVHYVEPFHIKEGPVVDLLDRFATKLWYGRFAAPGYTAFQEHFKCRRSHFNDDPDLKYVWYIIKLWVKGKLPKKEEDYDY